MRSWQLLMIGIYNRVRTTLPVTRHMKTKSAILFVALAIIQIIFALDCPYRGPNFGLGKQDKVLTQNDVQVTVSEINGRISIHVRFPFPQYSGGFMSSEMFNERSNQQLVLIDNTTSIDPILSQAPWYQKWTTGKNPFDPAYASSMFGRTYFPFKLTYPSECETILSIELGTYSTVKNLAFGGKKLMQQVGNSLIGTLNFMYAYPTNKDTWQLGYTVWNIRIALNLTYVLESSIEKFPDSYTQDYVSTTINSDKKLQVDIKILATDHTLDECKVNTDSPIQGTIISEVQYPKYYFTFVSRDIQLEYLGSFQFTCKQKQCSGGSCVDVEPATFVVAVEAKQQSISVITKYDLSLAQTAGPDTNPTQHKVSSFTSEFPKAGFVISPENFDGGYQLQTRTLKLCTDFYGLDNCTTVVQNDQLIPSAFVTAIGFQYANQASAKKWNLPIGSVVGYFDIDSTIRRVHRFRVIVDTVFIPDAAKRSKLEEKHIETSIKSFSLDLSTSSPSNTGSNDVWKLVLMIVGVSFGGICSVISAVLFVLYILKRKPYEQIK